MFLSLGDIILMLGGGPVFLLCAGLLGYFLPAVVSYVRGHAQRQAISLLNLLLGWTLLGWVVALVWAATTPPPRLPAP